MTDALKVTRPPKQERSRASFEKALDAAAALMAERGDDGFTLQEVTQRSGVSIGSIYGRVEGKRELVWAVQERVLKTMQPDRDGMLGRLVGHESLRALVPALVESWAELLLCDAPVVRAIMWVATRDPEVASRGALIHNATKAGLTELLLRHRREIERPDPDLAVDYCLTITYSALARYLGFGTAADAAGQGDWRTLKRELGVMALAYLTHIDD